MFNFSETSLCNSMIRFDEAWLRFTNCTMKHLSAVVFVHFASVFTLSYDKFLIALVHILYGILSGELCLELHTCLEILIHLLMSVK